LAPGATALASYVLPPVHAISAVEIVSKPPCLGATAILATVALTATGNCWGSGGGSRLGGLLGRLFTGLFGGLGFDLSLAG